MADVYVNSWSEFKSAVGSYDNMDNKIILPENAVWDMAEIKPYGDSFQIQCAEIDGRGTCIKNLVLNEGIYVYNEEHTPTIRNLEMKDWMCSGSQWIFDTYGGITMYSCTFSGMLASSVQCFCSNGMALYNCAFNIEASGSNFKLCFMYGASYFHYCRLELHLPNVTQTDPRDLKIFNYQDRCYFCELLLYAPNVISIGSGTFSGCVLRGNMTGVTQDFYSGSQGGIDWEGFVSIYKDDMFSNQFTPIQPLGFVCCTESQMKNPPYLRGKGFPIVVEDGADYTTVVNDTPPVEPPVEIAG